MGLLSIWVAGQQTPYTVAPMSQSVWFYAIIRDMPTAMTNDIHLAFAHPSERSEATTVVQPLDRISVRDHIVDVEIGAFQLERGTTQRVRFDIVVEVKPLEGPSAMMWTGFCPMIALPRPLPLSWPPSG